MDGRRIVDDFEESLLTERRGVLAVNEALFYLCEDLVKTLFIY